MLSQKWNGRFFEDTTLSSLGLVFQLGHINGDACPNPTQPQDLTVFDRSSAYRLVVHYCACEGAPPKRTQLLHTDWFPSAINDPSSAFTFDMLDYYHDLLNRSKNESAFHAIVSGNANGAGLNPEIVHFSKFICGSLTHRFSSVPTKRLLPSSSFGVSSNKKGLRRCTRLVVTLE